MDKQELFRNFDEEVFTTLTSLNSLLQTNVVSRDTKAIMKINRFRCWLMDYQDGTTK